MSSVTNERLDDVLRSQRARTDRRAALRGFVRQAAGMLIGLAIMVSVVVATIGLKSYFILSRLPLVH